MAATYKDSPSAGAVNGSNKVFTYDFPVLQTEDVKVALNGVTQATTKYTVSLSPANITFNNTSVDGTVQETDGSPSTGVSVRVYRETTVGKNTGDEDPKAVFAAGSSIRAGDLNANAEQALFGIHELQDKLILAENINTGAVTSDKILDDTIVNADVNTSAAIAGTKISPNFGSQAVVTTGTLAAGATTVTGNIAVSGTVDGRDVATDGSKLDGIETGATADQTDAQIRTAVGNASDSNVFTDAEKTKLAGISTAATADQTAAEIRTLVESASDSNVFTDADHTKLNAIAASANNYVHPNHSGEVTSTADGAQVVADNIIDEANLKVDNSPTNDYVLTAKSSAAGGLTWAPGGNITVQEEGSSLSTAASTLNFVGANVTASGTGATKTITVSGSGEVTVQDEGSALSTAATTLNFTGAGVTASGSGATKTITISGGGGAGITTDFQYLELKAHNNASGAFSAGSADYELVTKGTNTAVTPAQASALLINIAGVLQEPNTGTSIGSNDGFCIDGSSIHFGANLTAHPDYILYLKGAGEVTALANNSVTNAKIEDDTIAEAKLDIHNAPSGTDKYLKYTSNGMEWATAGSGTPEGTAVLSTGESGTTKFLRVDGDGSCSWQVPPDTNTTYSVQDGQLSQNNFTDADHTKLNGIEASATADQTDAEIRAAVEAATDSNVFTDADHTKLNGIATSANAYVHPNHSGEVTSTADGATVIADNVVDEANLKVSNSPTNGYFLSAQSGDTGGLTWAAASGGGVTSDGQNNTVAGTNAGDSFTGTDATNNTLIGYDAGTAITTGDNNTAVGKSAVQANTTGSNNIGIGYASLAYNTTASQNTAVGSSSLLANTTGADNTAVGHVSLTTNTTGAGNTSLGSNSMRYCTTGNYNTGVGYISLQDVTDGEYNTAVGNYSGKDITTGDLNTALGNDALRTATTAGGNTAVGASALFANTTADNNTAIGRNALAANTTGIQNTAVGYNAASTSTTTTNNTAVGHRSLEVSTGTSNTAVGCKSLVANTTAGQCTAVGDHALPSNTTGASNTAVGYIALEMNTTGNYNTAVGSNALEANTTGASNNAFGYQALNKNTTGIRNVAFGNVALNSNTTGVRNVGIGYSALNLNTTQNYNTAVGYKSLEANVADSNTAFGHQALMSNTSGTTNVAVGSYCADAITTGNGNTHVGYWAGSGQTTPNHNTFIGYYSGWATTTGYQNTCQGAYSGYVLTTGLNNTFIGYEAGNSTSPSGAITTSSNNICLGNNSVSNIYCADTGISSSDKRDKTDVVDFTNGLNWVNQLKPVTYRWDKRAWYDDNTPDGSKKRNKKHIGFLAQDVLAVEGNPTNKDDMLVVNLNEDDTAYGLKYERLVPVLVNAIKELSTKVTALEAKVNG